jgi:hypothetical protein
VALVAGGTRAHAASDELPLSLDWQAPPECYSADMIRAELARIARVRPGRAPAKLSVRGRIERDGEQYRLSLTLERNGDVLERQLASTECRALGREVTLVVALAFGEGVELLSEEQSAAEAKREPATPEAARDEPPRPAPGALSANDSHAAAAEEPMKSEGLHAAAFLGGGVLLGALPAVAAHAFAGAELGWRRVWLAPQLDLVPPVNDALERGVDARYDGLGGALALCLGEPASSALFAVCATGSATAVRGRSSGATESGSAVAPWYTAGAAVSGAWPEHGLIAVRLSAALMVSLNRPRFVVDGLGEAHRIPLLVPNLSASVVLRP